MKRKIIKTADGSTTIHLEQWNEQYHSKHGAIQEAYHVFIKHGLEVVPPKEVTRILEIGFGTGLNALITLLEAEKANRTISYVGVEAFPVAAEEMALLNYLTELKATHLSDAFSEMHKSEGGITHQIAPLFKLEKRQQDFLEIEDKACFDLIYFDAFGARVQPELWTEIVFQKMYDALDDKGVLVTYSAKGSVRRAMQAVGFKVERLPGPPGKREMLRATKSLES